MDENKGVTSRPNEFYEPFLHIGEIGYFARADEEDILASAPWIWIALLLRRNMMSGYPDKCRTCIRNLVQAMNETPHDHFRSGILEPNP